MFVYYKYITIINIYHIAEYFKQMANIVRMFVLPTSTTNIPSQNPPICTLLFFNFLKHHRRMDKEKILMAFKQAKGIFHEYTFCEESAPGLPKNEAARVLGLKAIEVIDKMISYKNAELQMLREGFEEFSLILYNIAKEDPMFDKWLLENYGSNNPLSDSYRNE